MSWQPFEDRPYRSYRRSMMRPAWFIIGALVLLLAIGIPLYGSYSKLKTRIVTICDKEAVSDSNGGHQYRVYTSGGTFRVSDTIVDGARFNSADVYGRLQRGKTYRLTYYGYRFGFTSSFPNIKSATLLPPDQQQPNACD